MAALFLASLTASAWLIARARPAPGILEDDVLFLLASWEPFNLGLWPRFLGYHAAAAVMIAAALAYLSRRGLRPRFQLDGRGLAVLAALLVLLAGALVPLGVHVGFLTPHAPRFWPRQIVSYYAFVAPSEELVFRALVLALLLRVTRPGAALLLSSALFALSYTHLAGNGVFPNWTYAGFAFVCGLAYGGAYLRSGSLLAPILLHGTVDTVWRTWLS